MQSKPNIITPSVLSGLQFFTESEEFFFILAIGIGIVYSFIHMFCVWKCPKFLKLSKSYWPFLWYPWSLLSSASSLYSFYRIPIIFFFYSVFFLTLSQSPSPSSSLLFLICWVLIMHIQKPWEIRSATLILWSFLLAPNKLYLGKMRVGGQGREHKPNLRDLPVW